MSHHNSIQDRKPKKVSFLVPEMDMDRAPGNIPADVEKKELLIAGQGTFVFTIPSTKPELKEVKVQFSTEKGEAVQLTIKQSRATFYYRKEETQAWQEVKAFKSKGDKENALSMIKAKDGYTSAIDLNPACRYWISIDSLNKRLRYGKGEMRLSTALIDLQYDKVPILTDKHQNPEYTFFSTLKSFTTSAEIQPLTLWKDPVVTEPPAFVVPSSRYSMDDAVEGKKIPPSGLSKECQILYGNIADFELNTPDFPDFEQAIEYSIRTEGCVGHRIILEKLQHGEFKQDEGPYKEVYLRITLGHSQGESPGIPYVMEIWPVGCESPIHHHGYTHAIIKVLRGAIDVDLYRMLPSKFSSYDPLATVTFDKGDVTYLMPEVNQYHKLKNDIDNSKTCITIQCYSYGQDDDQHYATFDYVEGKDKELGHFDPISDYDFKSFKEEVRSEWETYLAKRFWKDYKKES